MFGQDESRRIIIPMSLPLGNDQPHTDYNGLIIGELNSNKLWTIDQGLARRWLSGDIFYRVYSDHFRSPDGHYARDLRTQKYPDLLWIKKGADWAPDVTLVRGYPLPHVYLYENGKKRIIITPGAMETWQFDGHKVMDGQQALIDNSPDGPPI